MRYKIRVGGYHIRPVGIIRLVADEIKLTKWQKFKKTLNDSDLFWSIIEPVTYLIIAIIGLITLSYI